MQAVGKAREGKKKGLPPEFERMSRPEIALHKK